jgi:hypothetical protein
MRKRSYEKQAYAKKLRLANEFKAQHHASLSLFRALVD